MNQWKLNPDGITANRILENGCFESRLISAIDTSLDGEILPPDAPTTEQIIAALENAVQTHLDREAQAKGYDNIVSACSYAAAPNPFQTESVSFLTWRAAVWTKCYQTLAAVQIGAVIPTESELIASLPLR